MFRAMARSGGHVTLIFTINDEPTDLDDQGSTGAGFCLQQGAEATVTIIENVDDKSLEISVTDPDGENVPMDCLELYTVLIEELERSSNFTTDNKKITLSVKLELPRSQGFGMSAAGLLSAAKALIAASNIDDESLAYLVTHRTERIQSSGLGDVLALSAGGIELRFEPGSPCTKGKAVGFTANIPMILVWSNNEERHTRLYIDNPNWKERISSAGRTSIKRLRDGEWGLSRWNDLLTESSIFAEESGLLGEDSRYELFRNVESILDMCDFGGDYVPRLCMLGTSVAILPKSLHNLHVENIQKIISELDKRQLENKLVSI